MQDELPDSVDETTDQIVASDVLNKGARRLRKVWSKGALRLSKFKIRQTLSDSIRKSLRVHVQDLSASLREIRRSGKLHDAICIER